MNDCGAGAVGGLTSLLNDVAHNFVEEKILYVYLRKLRIPGASIYAGSELSGSLTYSLIRD